MMPIRPLLLKSGSGGSSPALDKAAVAQAFPGSTFSTNSTSYVDLLNGSGGAVISVTLQKGSGSNVLVAGGGVFTVGTSTQITLGVHDGTTTHDVAQRTIDGVYKAVEGQLLLSGLAAGSYTFTLKIKITGSTAVDFDANCSAFVSAWEVAP